MHAASHAAPHARDDMLAEVAAGLARSQKEVSPKYFYDRRGSELFHEITRLPEYYLTRTERALLHSFVPGWVASEAPASLVELGAGSADKTRIILDAMGARDGASARRRPVYVPVDISGDFLESVAAGLRHEYPALEVLPMVADISRGVARPDRLPAPAIFALLGSTIGNFKPDSAVRLLGHVRHAMDPADRLLLGVDLRKDRATLEAAYNDEAGITAAFNRNILSVLNHRLGANFDPDGFEHCAYYSEEHHRIEMHLVARRAQTVHIPGLEPVHIQAGETIRTELSHKYDRETVAQLFRSAGLTPDRWESDDAFALAVATAA
ncbi:MAG: L-histidine N(alpha)-methyltransferase [Gemmatimonadota bacterium]|jgi:L-histidine N-alpha-methyltransferase